MLDISPTTFTFESADSYDLAVILNVRNPLGFNLYDVMFVDTGEKITTTRLHLEPVKTESLSASLFDDFTAADDNQASGTEPQPQRFENLSSEDLDRLQNCSKSEKTHSMTRWGIKIFRGRPTTLFSVFFCRIHMIVPSSTVKVRQALQY